MNLSLARGAPFGQNACHVTRRSLTQWSWAVTWLTAACQSYAAIENPLTIVDLLEEGMIFIVAKYGVSVAFSLKQDYEFYPG